MIPIIKKVMCLLCFLLLLIPSVSGCGTKISPTIYDSSGKAIKGATAYQNIAELEAIAAISLFSSCDAETAKQKLYNKEYLVYTYFDSAVNSALENATKKYSESFNLGCAITDTSGRIVAAVSSGTESSSTNFAIKRTAPYSAFKPIVVYAPAIELGKINYSTTFEDSPYKKLKDENGKLVDWPQNPTGRYSLKNTPVNTAIKQSLNTIAVKCLKNTGVAASMDFVSERFKVDFSYESEKLKQSGEDEVIGNVALGYLPNRTSPVDMAGYYQIFANGGTYEKPAAVLKIVDKNGKTIYSDKSNPERVISSEASGIMNKLLQGVLDPDGTANAAKCQNVTVAGKTGTGDNFTDNWFVGVTPEYCCAVWHSTAQKNQAPEIFSEIFSKIRVTQTDFSFFENITETAICSESGKKITASCPMFDVGYYAKENMPDICDIH